MPGAVYHLPVTRHPRICMEIVCLPLDQETLICRVGSVCFQVFPFISKLLPRTVALSSCIASSRATRSTLAAGKCPCGRTHLRIDRIKGRSDDMFIIKGVNIFPMQVEKILVQFPELGSNYLITLETVNNQDEMIVEVELSDLSTDNYIELEKIRRDIIRQLKDEILVTPKVKLVKKGSLPQSEGKAVRVKDVRDNK